MVKLAYKKSVLSLAVALGLSLSGSALAGGDEMDALNARIAALEAQVQALLKAQAPAVDTQNVEATAAQAAEVKVNEIISEHHAAQEAAAKKNSYKFGGYVKADINYSDYDGGSVASGQAGRDFYIPGLVPVGTNGENYLDFGVKESRINFTSNHLLDNGSKIKTFVEMDFLLSGHGDERISNSYNPRLRHAFISYDNWTFGQTWMTFFNVGALPENLDFVGPAEATIFGRQAMVRYTNGPWQFALENPETTITPFGGGGRIVADDNLVPDIVLRYNHKGDWGTFTVAAMLRQLSYDGGGVDDTTSAYGLSLSGKHKIGAKDDFLWMASTGSGMGRYLGLNLANDAVLTSTGSLKAIDSSAIFGSIRHFWNDQWRSNFTLGFSSIDNPTALTGTGVTSDASSIHANLIFSPVPKLDFGVELMRANREIESGVDGNLTRLQFSAKYGF